MSLSASFCLFALSSPPSLSPCNLTKCFADAAAPQTNKWGDEKNIGFSLSELHHECEWVVAARSAREARNEGQPPVGDGMGGRPKEGALAWGKDEGGRYEWTQTKEDVEVRVLQGIPTGPTARKRIQVKYGGGVELNVLVDGASVLRLPKLVGRVKPDECSWLLDGEALVVTMEKVEAQAWVSLTLG